MWWNIKNLLAYNSKEKDKKTSNVTNVSKEASQRYLLIFMTLVRKEVDNKSKKDILEKIEIKPRKLDSNFEFLKFFSVLFVCQENKQLI